MAYPAFFDQAPSIVVHDSLAEFLGASSDGLLTYQYIDAVRLAGHSCPTVAGAYLMARRALLTLFPNQTPERGTVKVSFSAPLAEGVTGVIASVISLVTGAAGAGGFKGIGGKFCRQDLLHFASDLNGQVMFERINNGASVHLATRMHQVPADPRTGALLQKILAGLAAQDETREFAVLWQARVKKMLIEHADDPELIIMTTVKSSNQ